MFRLSISYCIIKYKLSYYARRKEEGMRYENIALSEGMKR